MKLLALLLLLPLLWLTPAAAIGPDEALDDAALESRARALFREIRCVVCQNESIDSSNADLARDLRGLVRERLVAGDSDDAVLDGLVARYGDFVLLRPPVKGSTLLLWIGPGVVLLLGLLLVAMTLKKRRQAAAPTLAPEDLARAEALLSEPPEMTKAPETDRS